MHFALFQRYITTGKDICPKSAPFRGRSGPHLVQGSVGPRVCPFPQTASRSIQPFLHNSPVFPTQTMEPSNHPLFQPNPCRDSFADFFGKGSFQLQHIIHTFVNDINNSQVQLICQVAIG